jgi:hypothetical protein
MHPLVMLAMHWKLPLINCCLRLNMNFVDFVILSGSSNFFIGAKLLVTPGRRVLLQEELSMIDFPEDPRD